MAELKECPICGAPARLLMHDGFQSFSIEALPRVEVVRCRDCALRGDTYRCPMRTLVMPVQGAGSVEDNTEDNGYCSRGYPKKSEGE